MKKMESLRRDAIYGVPAVSMSHRKRCARGNICAVSLLAKFPFWHYNGFKQTHCDRGKRRRSGAFREPVAGANRRPGPFGKSTQCVGTNGRVHHCAIFLRFRFPSIRRRAGGARPLQRTSRRPVIIYRQAGWHRGSSPSQAMRDRRTFLFSQSFQGGRSKHAGHQSDSHEPRAGQGKH